MDNFKQNIWQWVEDASNLPENGIFILGGRSLKTVKQSNALYKKNQISHEKGWICQVGALQNEYEVEENWQILTPDKLVNVLYNGKEVKIIIGEEIIIDNLISYQLYKDSSFRIFLLGGGTYCSPCSIYYRV